MLRESRGEDDRLCVGRDYCPLADLPGMCGRRIALIEHDGVDYVPTTDAGKKGGAVLCSKFWKPRYKAPERR